jgi:uncharacterized membrane-anchored protein
MNRILLALILVLPLYAADPGNAGSDSKEEKGPSLVDLAKWTYGPFRVDLDKYAQLELPDGFMFTGAQGTQRILEDRGNPTSGNELGFLMPTNGGWFVVFRFEDVGYVKDDDKNKLNPDKLLKSIKEGTEASNKLREKMGTSAMHIIGWEYPPKYNDQTHNLEWAIRAESDGRPVINYNTRLLGRAGVMEAVLVINPTNLSATLPKFQEVLTGYHYKSGQNYAEYRQGDKLAKYGLAALVTGGAAAVAVKTGLLSAIILFFKKAAKLVVVAVVAIGAFIKRLVFGRGREEMKQ